MLHVGGDEFKIVHQNLLGRNEVGWLVGWLVGWFIPVASTWSIGKQ
jgi:hypothetical protein